MKEAIMVDVFCSIDKKNELSFVYEDDIIILELNGKEICSIDWSDNLEPAVKRMLELWKIE